MSSELAPAAHDIPTMTIKDAAQLVVAMYRANHGTATGDQRTVAAALKDAQALHQAIPHADLAWCRSWIANQPYRIAPEHLINAWSGEHGEAARRINAGGSPDVPESIDEAGGVAWTRWHQTRTRALAAGWTPQDAEEYADRITGAVRTSKPAPDPARVRDAQQKFLAAFKPSTIDDAETESDR